MSNFLNDDSQDNQLPKQDKVWINEEEDFLKELAGMEVEPSEDDAEVDRIMALLDEDEDEDQDEAPDVSRYHARGKKKGYAKKKRKWNDIDADITAEQAKTLTQYSELAKAWRAIRQACENREYSVSLSLTGHAIEVIREYDFKVTESSRSGIYQVSWK